MICPCCNELEIGLFPVCNVCFAKMHAIIHCNTCEEAEELLKSFYQYPTAKSALISSQQNYPNGSTSS